MPATLFRKQGTKQNKNKHFVNHLCSLTWLNDKKSIIEALSVRSKDGTGDLWALEGQHSLSRTSRSSFSRKIKLISGRQHLMCTCSSIMAVVETGRFLCKYNIWHRVPPAVEQLKSKQKTKKPKLLCSQILKNAVKRRYNATECSKSLCHL